MDWNEFIDQNRAEIDELIGPNQNLYTLISLKGILVSEIGKKEAFQYFEHWEHIKLTNQEIVKELRVILEAIKYKGKDIQYITPEERVVYNQIIKEEFT